MNDMFWRLWTFRYFVVSSIRNDLVNRFARSKLRGLWVIIHPLAQVAIYAAIFANIMAGRLPGVESKYGYAVYLMAGLLAWTLFNEIIERSLNLFVEQANLMKKIQFPRVTLPVVVLGARLVSNVILLATMMCVFLLLGHHLTFAVLWLVPLTLALAGLAIGLGLVLGIMNVFVRDLAHLTPILMQVWFWFTPIVYPINIIPEDLRWLFTLNPMFHVINAYRDVIVYGVAPQLTDLGITLVLAIASLSLGMLVFRRASNELVDAL